MTEHRELRLDSIDRAIEDVRRGKPVVVVDDDDRENEGDLIVAAQHATPELVAFMVRHTSGYLCVALPEEEANRFDLPPMVSRNEDLRQTAYTVTVDAATGTTGISAASRAKTIRRLADPASTRESFTRPGHVNPLRARPGGVLARNGHTEAAVDLARLAGLRPVGALCEVVSEQDPTDMARGEELRRFADTHDLALVSIAQLIDYRRRVESDVDHGVQSGVESGVELLEPARLPTADGEVDIRIARDPSSGIEHVVLTCGDVGEDDEDAVLVRIHSECLTGDIFGSRRCDCGEQLHASLRAIQAAGRGVLIYLRGQEGRGIGLAAKLRAYQLQDTGLDTVDANLEQGLPVDARDYSAAGRILEALGVRRAILLTNNPAKRDGLEDCSTQIVGRRGLPIEPTEDSIDYLRTKRDRMGHDLPAVAVWDARQNRRAAQGKGDER